MNNCSSFLFIAATSVLQRKSFLRCYLLKRKSAILTDFFYKTTGSKLEAWWRLVVGLVEVGRIYGKNLGADKMAGIRITRTLRLNHLLLKNIIHTL